MADSHAGRLRELLGARYRIDDVVGRGASSTVYRAYDLRHDRPVAVKVLDESATYGTSLDRFTQEIRVVAKLSHSGIVPLFDSGVAEGLCYYVMPLIDGETLKARLARDGPLPIAEALTVARDIADALGFAHTRGVIHRDVKPGNVLLANGHALVADFGLSRLTARGADGAITSAGLAVGTPHYMSPEQASGAATVDHRTDLYSLGCLLHEMLCGDPPFTGRSADMILARHLTERPTPIRTLRSTVPVDLQALLDRLLAKLPADRFSSADDVVRTLDAIRIRLGAPDPSTTLRARRPRGTRRALAGVVASLAVAGGAYALFAGLNPEVVLDSNRILVLPLSDSRTDGVSADGEDAAIYIGYQLDGTAPLRWMEAGPFLDAESRSRASRLSPSEITALGRRAGAAHVIDGSILRDGDSLRTILRLFSVEGDSIVSRAGESSIAAASVPALAVRAISRLLGPLLSPGQRVDPSALAERSPSAIAHFFQGERAYSAMHFAVAVSHYEAALRDDSVFALAALKGAMAAHWRAHTGHPERLLASALAHRAMLPKRYADHASAFGHYIAGRADSALVMTRVALGQERDWPEAWMTLGSIYYRLLPDEPAAETLALAAYDSALAADSLFWPPRYHQAEIALRHGDTLPAARLLAVSSRSADERELREPLVLAVECLRRGTRMDWTARAREHPTTVVAAGSILRGPGKTFHCAVGAFTAVLDAEDADRAATWGSALALTALHGLALDTTALTRIARRASARGLPGWSLPLLVFGGTGLLPQRADSAATEMLRRAELPMSLRWLLTTWALARDRAADVRALTVPAPADARAGWTRSDSLLGQVLTGYDRLSRDDTTGALRAFDALKPTAPQTNITWDPWESLAAERLLAAELHLARGGAKRAMQLASLTELHAPTINLLHLRRSLELRARAARALGDADAEATARGRLASLPRERASPGRR